MKHIQISRMAQKKIGTLGILSLLALTQLGAAPQAAWSDSNWRNDDRIETRRENRRRVTLTGRVEDDQRGPNAFVLRANGRTYLVDTRNSNEPNLDRGDTVEVRGRINGAGILADDVRVIERSRRDDDRRDRRDRRNRRDR